MSDFEARGLDHVHLRVSDRGAAAAWFGRVLGLRVAEAFCSWSDDPRGPLFLQTASGRSCLALFQGAHGTGGDHTIAFATDAAGFAQFVADLADGEIKATEGQRLTRNAVVDHELAWSIYFVDPDGNHFELTTCDYAAARDLLATSQGPDR